MLKGVLVGFGEVSRNGHWPGYEAHADVEIVAVVDQSAERRALASSLSPRITAFASLAEIPPSASIDFVDICTPPSLHAEPMLDALGRGWHVLCEKPFLLDPAVLDVARARAMAAGVALMPVHNWKYAPIVRGATAALRAGAIGALNRVEVDTSRMQAAPTAQAGGLNWRNDPAIAGGGILMDHGWHSVYLALHWFGRKATGVRATLHRLANGGGPGVPGVEDEARVVVDFPTGDATITLTWNGSVRRNAMRLEGERGEIIVADDTLHVNGTQRESTTFPSALSAGSAHADWFAAMLPDVLAGFRDPVLSRPVLEEAAETLSIIRQAYGSDVPDVPLIAPCG
jgi:predicted dehydrogenase